MTEGFLSALVQDRFDVLFKDVTEVIFTDFPDYANVGDSAIALGVLAYLKQRRIVVSSVYSIDSLDRGSVGAARALVINGGGSFGGLYPIADRNRVAIAQAKRSDAILIQAPQSVHFSTDQAEIDLMTVLAATTNFRLAVRDAVSGQRVDRWGIPAVLSPDSAHLLRLPPRPPTRALSILQRSDFESRDRAVVPEGADWLRDTPSTAMATKARKITRFTRRPPKFMRSEAYWTRVAEGRLQRGLRMLDAEVVITDRLHAMILALKLGRRVIAVDNSNGKLSEYAATWLSTEPSLEFAESFTDARARVHS
ncbi:putative pyruvyl transferase EpsO [Cnuibacter physcomitrellae]|uniref:Polysaccharide pyruvyl transferase domain-containing protein n=1 Tax=Cnuibacter physcomitrellae TaxID=1619308 RepID=A0A1X9LLQ9_9MICO|nr:polysaccharide pyruvyl transferase family protein [Cnuibacter physcomitrellae]ARJ06113.1 hypothetical protein B5808_13435 [Cnuibacter physcomitrellae]GGI37244.1 putative pyruvyl transferase EpsO [Cnuibacter physcomitrellae]